MRSALLIVPVCLALLLLSAVRGVAFILEAAGCGLTRMTDAGLDLLIGLQTRAERSGG
jgi:hypothetical protein